MEAQHQAVDGLAVGCDGSLVSNSHLSGDGNLLCALCVSFSIFFHGNI